ncbi:MAG: PDZ domain-containing protein [Planctomycetes bacterium]|nr:PDZ domain-containing protein [Planctomycetota bacterium]
MKTQNRFIVAALAVTLFALPLYAQARGQSYIGVLLDSEPLSPLLSKHLRLEPDQGLRIRNLHRGGPADQAGLERDDIITMLNGRPVVDFPEFAETISQTGAGQAVTVEIIRLGRRQDIAITLAEKSERFDPKYPREPDVVHTWQPGKVFHFDPAQDHWIDLNIEPLLSRRLHRSLSEQYEFRYSDGDHPVSVSISGDPHDSDSSLVCKRRGKTFRTTIGKIRTLPTEVRDTAERAVRAARRDSRQKSRTRVIKNHTQTLWDLIEDHPVEEWQVYTESLLEHLKDFIDKHELPKHFQNLKESQGDRLKSIEEKLDRLFERFERLEEKKDRGTESTEPDSDHGKDHQEEEHKERTEIKVLRLKKSVSDDSV